MRHEDDNDAFPFVEAPGPLIRPKNSKKKSLNLAPFGVYAILALMVAGFLNQERVVRAFRALSSDAPPTPPAPAVANRVSKPRPAPRPSRPPVVVVRATPKPPEPTPEPTVVQVVPPVVEEPTTPEGILRAKGLEVVNNSFVLADKEKEAYRAFKNYEGSFNSAYAASERLFEVEARHRFIDGANRIKAGLRFNSEDLEIAMASVYRRCGPRERSLNSAQIGWHYQELQNRQDINNLNRIVENLRDELRNYAPREEVNREFDNAFAASRSGFASVGTHLNSLNGAYAELNADATVRKALADYNRTNNCNKTVGPTNDARDSMRLIAKHAQYYR